jgi:hypothetical protein
MLLLLLVFSFLILMSSLVIDLAQQTKSN